jgi:membrane-bound lytic murein transglycosylase F
MIRALTLGWLVLIILSGCTKSPVSVPVPDPDTTKELVVTTRYGPATYYLDAESNRAGYTYDVIQAFASQNGWTLKWQESESYADLFETLHKNRTHLVATSLIAAAVEEQRLLRTPPLYETRVVVVTRDTAAKIRNLADLGKVRLGAMADSGHLPLLVSAHRKYPKLSWTTLQDVFPEELLSRLAEGELDAVVVNEQDFDLARNHYPSLKIAYSFAGQQPVVWALPHRSSKRLAIKLNQFFIESRRNGKLKQIYERYFGHVKRLEPEHAEGILDRRLSTLPRYRKYFHEAENVTSIDWRLLAAIGYQESRWDPYATSFTGVRGLMMLTNDTADRMGVTDRLDPRQSILAGAKYLSLLKESLPARIAEPDKTWLALAAYNQGLGHLEDARRIAQAKGMNPDSWADVKQTLPLLSRGGYKGVMRYGYARGGEAVIFVESIRNYYDILARLESDYSPLLFGRGKLPDKLALLFN